MDIRFRLRRMKWAIKLLHCGTSVKFWKSVVIHSPTCVSIGNNIGDNVLIATHSVITSQGHDVNATVFKDSSFTGEINIEDNVWVGAGVIVLPNVTIGKNSIIAAGSVVSKSIPANSIAVGSPCKVIKKIARNN